jgi:hypothetical protein
LGAFPATPGTGLFAPIFCFAKGFPLLSLARVRVKKVGNKWVGEEKPNSVLFLWLFTSYVYVIVTQFKEGEGKYFES